MEIHVSFEKEELIALVNALQHIKEYLHIDTDEYEDIFGISEDSMDDLQDKIFNSVHNRG